MLSLRIILFLPTYISSVTSIMSLVEMSRLKHRVLGYLVKIFALLSVAVQTVVQSPSPSSQPLLKEDTMSPLFNGSIL